MWSTWLGEDDADLQRLEPRQLPGFDWDSVQSAVLDSEYVKLVSHGYQPTRPLKAKLIQSRAYLPEGTDRSTTVASEGMIADLERVVIMGASIHFAGRCILTLVSDVVCDLDIESFRLRNPGNARLIECFQGDQAWTTPQNRVFSDLASLFLQHLDDHPLKLAFAHRVLTLCTSTLPSLTPLAVLAIFLADVDLDNDETDFGHRLQRFRLQPHRIEPPSAIDQNAEHVLTTKNDSALRIYVAKWITFRVYGIPFNDPVIRGGEGKNGKDFAAYLGGQLKDRPLKVAKVADVAEPSTPKPKPSSTSRS
ncbi:hypothetical protein HDV05_002354, partial [Chytridiales sp. JEL 0842]